MIVDPTLPALHRIRKYLRSTGRYGPSPFLFGHYGGVGENAQGFCRASAVAGATYILGRNIVAVETTESPNAERRRYSLRIDDVEESIESDVLIASHDYVSIVPPSKSSSATSIGADSHSIAHCIAIIDRPISFSESEPPSTTTEISPDTEFIEETLGPADQKVQLDTAILVFPPGSVTGGSETAAVHALVTGEASMSSPKGKCELYKVNQCGIVADFSSRGVISHHALIGRL